jgi:tRNA(Ile)-lysidine synthase
VKYLVAVSGGIDSVVLLDMLARAGTYDLVVAHFDHGIRQDSAADARFVAALAKKYDLPFVTKREELGANVSEDRARTRRYEFLRTEAKKHDAVIVTAHHRDDVVESIAINLIRGTGWRGLAVLGDATLRRPLLHFSKAEIRDYARGHRLEWVEDSTNATETYLRNRLRRRIKLHFPEESETALIKAWKRQLELKNEIDEEAAKFAGDGECARYPLIMIDQAVASELLRTQIKVKTGRALTRPQVERALLAVKTARTGSTFQAGMGVTLRFTLRTFVAQAD